jgi:hypothetical protein
MFEANSRITLGAAEMFLGRADSTIRVVIDAYQIGIRDTAGRRLLTLGDLGLLVSLLSSVPRRARSRAKK